ncbi:MULTISPECIES: TolC family outer membrane protein [Thalassospira]|uniref:TolC family outer membrane protein n=3 Tax=Thalassospira TaxID=168934 RepID=A0A8I1M9F2_9PROT|nr:MULTISPECIES: TolC family outer membrane protein [Thalassospira]MEE3044674.1 TolC family outer membrane protein [Pseudomonadota bacterium]RCK24804.1 type I secretion protein TolC [Thalassospira profundimaris]HAY49381.1 type I secretion protein TolC [Thalassospira sp.]KZB60888.1 type I secretion protein TolC [Thalassospira sp. MCCC 1A02491]MBN8197209.1 TolC family outer membrane protein [Thalassospira povalilytica]|eukprot:TRINITY_DN3199_c0_g1_i1.p1 TRINITY_DN3199_c0_g1~~TRINITY_DN3199_c0_g1_i1.p1  ORF type:complete len:451 (+),score=90.39 TRINITY_DN3199_c0_g1_i1:939-2291(+)
MIKRFLLTCSILATGGLVAGGASAESLEDALIKAYQSNPTLEAGRASLRSTDEEISAALSNWRPSVTLSGDAGFREYNTEVNGSETENSLTPYTVGLNVTQPLYRGGRTTAQTERAEARIKAARAALRSTEQDVMLQVATAYFNVLRDTAVVELNQNNVRVLERQLEATRDRFAVGEVTRTDVSQAEARLAGAKADLISAQGALANTRAQYERLVGNPPTDLEIPNPLAGLPTSVTDVLSIAQGQHPDVLQALYTEEAAQSDIRLNEGSLYPEVNLSAGVERAHEGSTEDFTADSADIIASVSVPLYQKGAVFSGVRAAKQTAGQARIQVDEARRAVIENATSAWETLVTARASIESQQAQVSSAEVALDGVQREASVGSRTVLDVLDQEQELLQARVDLVGSRRDAAVAEFQVKAAMGALNAQVLGLPVEVYDTESNYNKVKDQWWGTD